MVGCIHIPDFPAWAVSLQHPGERRLAVHERGRIISRSPALRSAGLSVGQPLERARALFPEVSFYLRDRPLEYTVWESVLERLYESTPFLEPGRPGWAYFLPGSFADACDLSAELVAQVGLAPDKCTARLAAVKSAPGSVLQIKTGYVRRFLDRTSVNVLARLGIEEDILERFQLFGLDTLGKIAGLTRHHLQVQFGTTGADIYALLHPEKQDSHIPLYMPPVVLTESYDFEHPAEEPGEILPSIHLLLAKLRLRLGPRLCRRLTIRIQNAGTYDPIRVSRIFREATDNSGQIFRTAVRLILSSLRRDHPVETVSVSLSALRNPRHSQGVLFTERPPVAPAIRNIDERFPGAIVRAVILHPNAPFPEDAIRFVPFSDTHRQAS